MNNNSKNIVTKAEYLRKHKLKKRIAIISAILLLTIIIAVYIATYVYTGFGSFTISVNKKQLVDYGISLSEKSDSSVKIPKLNAIPLDGADAIHSEDMKNVEELHTTDGSHNGKNYMAYTFYCLNIGKQYEFECDYSIVVKSVTKNLDEAIRIQLFIDDVDQGIYGKQEPGGLTPLYNYDFGTKIENGVLVHEKDENGNIIYDRSEKNQIKKFSSTTIMKETVKNSEGEVKRMKPGDYTKFTVLMWLEGSDPECIDTILGGSMRIDMEIVVNNAVEIAEE